MKKKKTLQDSRMGYCPFFFLSVSHNTTSCIMTQGLTGMAWETGLGARQARARGAQGAHKGRSWSATIRPAGPRYRPRHGQGWPRHGRQRARDLAGGLCLDTQFCIVTEASDWPLGGGGVVS